MNNIESSKNELFLCHCGGRMIQIMDTFLCPSCEQTQIEEMNWVRQHIETREREGKKP